MISPPNVKRLALRGALGVTLSAGLAISCVAPAFAGENTTTTTTTTANVKVGAGTSFHAQLKLWQSQRQDIARAFRSAVAAARHAFNIAKSQAVTSADRYAARTQFEAAIALAAENRSTQLIALGSPPSPGTNSTSHDSSRSKIRVGRQSDLSTRRGSL